jgi:cholesterol transport system auxiliary component
MNTHPRRLLLSALVVAALTLSGCLGSLAGRVPDSLLTLSADEQPPARSAREGTVATSLTVLVPSVPQKLRTPRIPVITSDTSIAYVQNAQWVEPPARLFQRLLSETVAARTNRLVLDESQYISERGELLAGELLEFGIEAGTNEAVVTFQAMRVARNGETVSQRRFEARQLVGEVNAANVGVALNRAANEVAAEVAAWVAT